MSVQNPIGVRCAQVSPVRHDRGDCSMFLPCPFHDPPPESVVTTRTMRLAVAHEGALGDAVRAAATAARVRVLSELSLDEPTRRRAADRLRAAYAERRAVRRARRVEALLARARLTEWKRWPSRWVRLERGVCSDLWHVPGLPHAYAAPGVHAAWSNPHGALSVELPDGGLGIKPGEFADLGRWGAIWNTCPRSGCWSWIGDEPTPGGTRVTVGLSCRGCGRRVCLSCMDSDLNWLRCVDCAGKAVVT